MISLNDVKNYLSVDFDDDDELIKSQLEVAEIYVDECCGIEYKKDEKKVRLSYLIIKMLVKHMYENRSISIPQTMKENNVFTTILDVLTNSED